MTCFCFSCEAAALFRQIEAERAGQQREETRRQQRQQREAFAQRHGTDALRNLGRPE
jgi:hypothetical protein